MSRLLVMALTVGVVFGAARLFAQNTSFPNVKQMGRATVEYRDARVQVVAAYDYSQQNHDSPWLLVRIGISTAERLVFGRGDITIVTSDGRETMVATQQQFLADSPGIRLVRQNSVMWQREVGLYFPRSATKEGIRFFALPGEGIVNDDAVMRDSYGLITGDLYFESPYRRWDPGTYRLQVNHERARAALPIHLK